MGTVPAASPRSGRLPGARRLPAVPGTEPPAAMQQEQRDTRTALPWAALPWAPSPAPKTPREGEEHHGQLCTWLNRAREARAWSRSRIPICRQGCAGRASSLRSPLPAALGKIAALEGAGRAWGEGGRRNGFWPCPEASCWALLPDDSSREKRLFITFGSYWRSPSHKPFASADKSGFPSRAGWV